MLKEINALEANNVITNKNVNTWFFLYCLKKDWKLFVFIFINLFLYVYSFFFNNKIYEKYKYKYLNYVKDLDKKANDFVSHICVVNKFDLKSDLFICKFPDFLAKRIIKDKYIAYSLDQKSKVKMDEFNDSINKLKLNKLYINKKKDLKKYNNYKNAFLVNKKRIKIITNRFVTLKKVLSYIFIILLLTIGITYMSYFYTHQVFLKEYLNLYDDYRLFLMNSIPIIIVIIVLLFITRKISISFLLTSGAILILGVVNQTKLLYRDDVVKFEDIQLLREASIMAQRYDIVIKKYTVLFAIMIIIFFIILNKYLKRINLKYWKSLIVALIIILCCIFFNKYYFNEELYSELGDKSDINVWIATRQSQIRGLVYPFVYSIKDSAFIAPDNYSESDAIKILNNYSYRNIPDKKKANIIGIMLEAYNDFSKFRELNINNEVYKDFHEIQSKSISGNIVTSIFGGGTIATERNYLTGYDNLPSFRKSTNSFVWYFKEQGYKTEGYHPVYGAFYNRRTVNNSLGFENYCFYEEALSKYSGWHDFASDSELFDTIIKGYESNNSKNPYFSFSVTYQNHGPYINYKYDGKNYYFDNPGISEQSYNTINEYLDGIKNTNEELIRLIDYFEKVKEPTIIVLFGDHNPFLDNSYNEFNINMDISTVEGFKNYYETPYIIYGNSSAKKLFNKSFVEKSNDISPMFLMPKLFDYIGYDGNEYMQYMIDLMKKVDVVTTSYYKINNEFVPSYENDIVNDYKMVNYYWAKHFKSKLKK